MTIIQNNTSKVEYAYLVVVVECVHGWVDDHNNECKNASMVSDRIDRDGR